MLSDLLLRCVLLIVSDNEELAVIAYKAIQKYLQRTDLSIPAREKYVWLPLFPSQRAADPRSHLAVPAGVQSADGPADPGPGPSPGANLLVRGHVRADAGHGLREAVEDPEHPRPRRVLPAVHPERAGLHGRRGGRGRPEDEQCVARAGSHR